jgi:outer membrane protein
MKKMTRIFLLLNLVFMFTLIIVLSSYAQTNQTFSQLEAGLGLSPSGEYSNVDISVIPGHTVIKTTIADTTKLGGCEVGDKVELSNLSWKTWSVKHIPTGKQFLFEVKKEDGTLKISKIVPPKKGLEKGLTGKSGFGVRVFYANYQDENLGGVDVEPDDDIGFGVNYTAFVSENFSLELSADYIESDVELSGGGYYGDDELEQISVLLAGRIHPTLIGRILPYLSGGIGYFFNDMDSIDVDDSFGYFIGAGVEVFLSDSLSLNLDLKYIWTEIETDTDSIDIAEDPFIAGLGLKFYF